MKKSYLKTTGVFTERNVDKGTGEIMDENTVRASFIANSKEQFFIGYVSLLSQFKDISGPAIKVYAYLLQNYNPGTEIAINLSLKHAIMEFINSKSIGTIDNTLSDLCRANLLFKKPDFRGSYYINPRYAFKGSTHDRNGSLKAIIELGCKNC